MKILARLRVCKYGVGGRPFQIPDIGWYNGGTIGDHRRSRWQVWTASSKATRCLTPKDREGPSNRAMIILELVGEIFLPSQLQVARYDNVVVELRRDTNLAVASTGAKKLNVSDNEQCTRSYQRQETKFLTFESSQQPRSICDFGSRSESQVLKHTEGDLQHGNIWIKDMIKMKLHIRYAYNSKLYVHNPLESF